MKSKRSDRWRYATGLVAVDGSSFRSLRAPNIVHGWAGGRVVFQRPGASHWEKWTADANGANIAALTQPQTVLVDQLPSNVAPAYSPDGSQIVFLSNRTESGEAGAWRIRVMNADGSNQRALPIDEANQL